MTLDQRIIELTAQLLRTENTDVRETVGAELHLAIDGYLQQKHRHVLVVEFPRPGTPEHQEALGRSSRAVSHSN